MSALNLCAALIGAGVMIASLIRARVYGARMVAAAGFCAVVWAGCALIATATRGDVGYKWLIGDLWSSSIAATIGCLVVVGRRLNHERWRVPLPVLAVFVLDLVAIFALLNPHDPRLFGHFNTDGTLTFSGAWAVQGLYILVLAFVLATDLLRRAAHSTGYLRGCLVGALGSLAGGVAFQAAQIHAVAFFVALCALFLFGAVVSERAAEDVPEAGLAGPIHPTGRDPVTHVMDRAALTVELDQVGASAELALIVVDVDNLKPVNDTHGHVVGDTYLRVIANRIVSAVGDAERVSRFGGDEFVVVLPGASLEEAAALAAAIVEAVHQLHHTPRGALTPSVSAGVAVRRPGDDVLAVLEAADAAMYVAKRAGGDRMSIAYEATGRDVDPV